MTFPEQKWINFACSHMKKLGHPIKYPILSKKKGLHIILWSFVYLSLGKKSDLFTGKHRKKSFTYLSFV